jgi:hypothetical protein
LHQGGKDLGHAFGMPPGYVADEPNRQFSPMVFAAVGMGVMILSYLALMAFSPVR